MFVRTVVFTICADITTRGNAIGVDFSIWPFNGN